MDLETDLTVVGGGPCGAGYSSMAVLLGWDEMRWYTEVSIVMERLRKDSVLGEYCHMIYMICSDW